MRGVLHPWAALRNHRIGSLLATAFFGMTLFSAIDIFSSGMVFAGDAEGLAEVQKKLNAEIMEKPFSVEDTARIDAYIKDAMKKDLRPRQRPPARWRRGYTCADLHEYNEYRDCLYYYRYHGRYWE
jgi:hypothetical protein